MAPHECPGGGAVRGERPLTPCLLASALLSPFSSAHGDGPERGLEVYAGGGASKLEKANEVLSCFPNVKDLIKEVIIVTMDANMDEIARCFFWGGGMDIKI